MMDIQERKNKLIEKVRFLSESQLERVEAALKEEAELDQSLERAILQAKKGEVTPHEEVKKKYSKWL